MNSYFPTRCLFHLVAASPYRIAPEEAANLDVQLDKLNLTLEYTENPAVLAEYIPQKALVRLGGGYLDALWATVNMYVAAIKTHEQAYADGKTNFSIGDDVRLNAAYALYLDRLDLVATRKSAAWPKDAPKPIRSPFAHTDGYLTNELFLAAIAWVIHHEIAHAKLGHEDLTLNSVRDEMAADQEATRWVFSKPANDSERSKRALGMAMAILFLIALDLRLNRHTHTTHPPSWERLLTVLDEACPEEDHPVYARTFMILDVHLAHHNIRGPIDRGGLFRDMCYEACMLLRGGKLGLESGCA